MINNFNHIGFGDLTEFPCPTSFTIACARGPVVVDIEDEDKLHDALVGAAVG